MQDALDRLNVDRVVKCVSPVSRITSPCTDDILSIYAVIQSLQQPSGVFSGDSFGEVDTHFLYCAVNALSLLGKVHLLYKDKTVAYVDRCRHFDGGFGSCVGAESHAGDDVTWPRLIACLRGGVGWRWQLDVVDETLGW